MSHFPTACLPQYLPKAVAYFMHTILPAPEIQIISAKFCLLTAEGTRTISTHGLCLQSCAADRG